MKTDIQGVHTTATPSLRKYVDRKIGGLDNYLPRNCRASARAHVYLKESTKHDNNHCSCEAKIVLPKETIVVSENALNMFAAVDIVHQKLKQQIIKYGDLHGGKSIRHTIRNMRHRTL